MTILHRRFVSLAICVLALGLGACAGRAVTAPRLDAVFVVTSASPRPSPTPEIAVLPVRELHLDLLASIGTTLPAVAQAEPRCDIAAVVAGTAADQALKNARLSVGTTKNRYVEVRLGAVRPYQDYVKDVALRVLDKETCTTQIVIITKTYGTQTMAMPVKTKLGTVFQQKVQPAAMVKAPQGWDIEVVRRKNGIAWNSWATDFRIVSPQHRIVVGQKYPIVEDAPSKGRPRVTEFIYIAHGEELLEIPELVARGPTYGDDVYARASSLLRSRGVMSKAMKGTAVVDVPVLTSEMSFRRIANEHMDQFESTLMPDWATRRIFMVIGANGDQFGVRTCSPAAACGPRQFIKGTWKQMVDSYPAAKLEKNFTVGASDAVQSTMASILLDDNNLAALIEAFGPSILDDPQLEEYLTAAYNTGVGRVINVLRIAKQKKLAEWTEAVGKRCTKATKFAECLVPETKGYIVKLRFLKEEWPKASKLALFP